MAVTCQQFRSSYSSACSSPTSDLKSLQCTYFLELSTDFCTAASCRTEWWLVQPSSNIMKYDSGSVRGNPHFCTHGPRSDLQSPHTGFHQFLLFSLSLSLFCRITQESFCTSASTYLAIVQDNGCCHCSRQAAKCSFCSILRSGSMQHPRISAAAPSSPEHPSANFSSLKNRAVRQDDSPDQDAHTAAFTGRGTGCKRFPTQSTNSRHSSSTARFGFVVAIDNRKMSCNL